MEMKELKREKEREKIEKIIYKYKEREKIDNFQFLSSVKLQQNFHLRNLDFFFCRVCMLQVFSSI